MPYVIKRYANRKLYDTRTKRYLTLDEVSVLVRLGEDVRVEDADTGEDITGSVLTKILAEANRKAGSSLLPAQILVDLIQRPTETVRDAVRTSVSAGQRTVEQMSGEVGRLFDSVTGRTGRDPKSAEDDAERVRAIVEALGLPTREEFDALAARVAELEAKPKRRTAKAPAKRTIRTKKEKQS